MSNDLYAELGIPSDADEETIAAAKKKRQRETHPDAGGNAEEFDRVTQAALVLLDPDKRANYDATGSTEDPSMSDDVLLQNALGLIRQGIEAYIDAGRAEQQDIIALTSETLEASGRERQAQLGQLERKLRKQERMISRLTYHGTKANIIGNMMREKAAGIRMEIALCNDAIKAHAMAIEILEDYDWEHETVETQGFATGGPVGGMWSGPGKI